MLKQISDYAVLADTGPLYALVDTRDQYHERALQEFDAMTAQGQTLMLNYPVILECYNLLYKKHALADAHTWLNVVTQTFHPLNPQPQDYRQAAELIVSYSDQRLSLVDGVTTVLSKQFQLPVWTYDHHFDIMNTPVWRPGDIS